MESATPLGPVVHIYESSVLLPTRVTLVTPVVMTIERRVRPFELITGDFLEGTPMDPLGRVAQSFARNLRDAVAGRSGRAFERESGMSNASVMRILKGQVWPDAITIARLEIATGKPLWPRYDEHITP